MSCSPGYRHRELDNCTFCNEAHYLDECCECGGSATGQGKYAYLCADHAYEAYEDERADRV
jgi:hypothetical protein